MLVLIAGNVVMSNTGTAQGNILQTNPPATQQEVSALGQLLSWCSRQENVGYLQWKYGYDNSTLACSLMAHLMLHTVSTSKLQTMPTQIQSTRWKPLATSAKISDKIDVHKSRHLGE